MLLSVILKLVQKFKIGAWYSHPGIKLQLSGEHGNWPVTKQQCSIFRYLEFEEKITVLEQYSIFSRKNILTLLSLY